MKTLRLPSIVFLSFLFIGAYYELQNKQIYDKPGFKIAPEEQILDVKNIGGGATFQIINIDGCKSVRIEARSVGILGPWVTIPGYGNVSDTGSYSIGTSEIYNLLGIGVFVWRIRDNFNSAHVSETKLLIIIL